MYKICLTDSTYLPALSSEILHLQEKGILSDLQRKWWKEERKETTCAVASASDNVEALRLVNLGGVFVVLVVGCIVAIFFAFFELFTKSKDVPLNDGVSKYSHAYSLFKGNFIAHCSLLINN